VVGIDLHGRGDTQQFRLVMPDVEVTKDIAADARVRLEMRRDFFNAMVEHDAKVADWREAFTYGQAKAADDPEVDLVPAEMENHYDYLHLHSFYVRYKLPMMVEVQHFHYPAATK
jgi:hypothetical protein